VITITQIPGPRRSLDGVTLARLISPATRSGLLIAAGTALIVVPFAAGLGMAAVVTGIAVGVIGVALGLAGTDTEGRGTLPVSAQMVYDRGLALGLLVAGVAFGATGDQNALIVFGATGIGALLMTVTTRYSASPTYH
jgi:hypothetical protein